MGNVSFYTSTPKKGILINATIDDVRQFWDSSPLGTDFIPHEVGTLDWFMEFDRIKRNYGLIGTFDDWAPRNLQGKRVLDVGCGPGFMARLLIPRGAEYVGIDISQKSVGLAKRSLELLGLKGTLKVGNAEELEFEDSTFDYVVSEGVIHHTPDTQACINQIHRVLVPGGQAAVSVYYKTLLLRSPLAFRLAQIGMRAGGFVLDGRGREGMVRADTPENFVRMYDGISNPLGKAYTRSDLLNAFSAFSDIRMKRYFQPFIGPIVALPKFARLGLSKMGLMMLTIATRSKD